MTFLSTVFFLPQEIKQRPCQNTGLSCASVTRLLVPAKAGSPGEGIGQISGSMGGLSENTINYKIRFYLIKKLKELS